MMKHLSKIDLDIIIDSLNYTRKARQEYPDHPSVEFKNQQVSEIDKIMEKVRAEIKDWDKY